MSIKRIAGHGFWIGIIATGIMDLFNLWGGMAGLVRISDPKFLGRVTSEWLQGNFVNINVFTLPPVSGEVWLGIMSHYLIGIIVASAFLIVSYRITQSIVWKWWPVAYGLATCLLSWFLFFPSIGLGFFGSEAPPQALILRGSIFNHLSYGIGLMAGMFILDRLRSFMSSNPFAGENGRDDKILEKIPTMLIGLASMQAIAMVGMTSMLVMGSLLLVDMAAGDPWMAGLPVAIILLTSAIAAYPMAVFKDKKGYRTILLIASASGTCGALLAILGVKFVSIPLVLFACALIGVANGTILLSRFAAAETAPVQKRGKSVSIVMTGAMVGAISAPFVTNLSNKIGDMVGLESAIGPFILVAILYLVAGFITTLTLKIEPSEISKLAEWKTPDAQGNVSIENTGNSKNRIIYSIGSLLFIQMAMVFLMAVTPAHMHHNHYGMGAISAVITVHFIGMYGLSFFSGYLADRFGRSVVITTGSFLLIISCLIGLMFSSLAWLTISLFLLGLGWNFGFLSGTVMVADSLRENNMGRLQGTTDSIVSFASAAASLGSGFALSVIGFSAMTIIGISFALIPIALLLFLRHQERELVVA